MIFLPTSVLKKLKKIIVLFVVLDGEVGEVTGTEAGYLWFMCWCGEEEEEEEPYLL